MLLTVKKNVQNVAMAISFLNGILQAAAERKLPEDVANTVFCDVTSDLAECFSVRSLGPTQLSLGPFHSPAPTTGIDLENINSIATLLCHCLSLKLDAEIDQIIEKIIAEMELVGISFFDTIYLPLLKVLQNNLTEMKGAGNVHKLSKLYKLTLAAYLARFVKAEPQPPRNWAMPKLLGCECLDCIRLDAFLTNPDEKVARFAVKAKRRHHLHKRLDRTSCENTTERIGDPGTLVVTKTKGDYKVHHMLWRQRCGTANLQILDLRCVEFKSYLGDMYKDITSLSPSLLSPSTESRHALQLAATLSPSANTSNRVLPPITKRKVPKVIVTDDDGARQL